MKDIEDQWKQIKFSVVKFTKGKSERGYILGGVTDVMTLLDEHIMSLQGMSASRFIGPFRNTVYDWEKTLSCISEVIEVSGFDPPCCEDLFSKLLSSSDFMNSR